MDKSRRLETVKTHQKSKSQNENSISQKVELKFFIIMTILFFVVPLLIIQIPAVEKVGDAILYPFMKIIESQ